jgi:tartrate-resistant acid phosphatase type 5
LAAGEPPQRRALIQRVLTTVLLLAGVGVALVIACVREARSPDGPTFAIATEVPRGSPATSLARTAQAPRCAPPKPAAGTTRLAVIGDYGYVGTHAARVAALVRSRSPEFVITTGDNNYTYGEASTIDANIGQYYSDYICPYIGAYGKGASENRFFPSLGNHDWYTRSLPYLSYFELPGNERYYDFVWGNVHLFAIDSDPHEPAGITADSSQASWLKSRLAASKTRWQIVYFHHPPFSSGSHGSSPELRWPFAQWGADLVLAGHDHHYERVELDGVTYIVNGLGGRSIYRVGAPIRGSVVRYAGGYGAQFIEASATRLVSRFYTVDSKLIDERVLGD